MNLTELDHSSIIGVGIDLIDIVRIKKAHLKYGPVFLDRIFTEEELNYCLNKKNPYPSLAVRFAAKEAASKAFGYGIGQLLSWKSIGIKKEMDGKPMLYLDSQAQKLLAQKMANQALVSLTHTHTLAQAIVILTRG